MLNAFSSAVCFEEGTGLKLPGLRVVSGILGVQSSARFGCARVGGRGCVTRELWSNLFKCVVVGVVPHKLRSPRQMRGGRNLVRKSVGAAIYH